MGRDSEWWRGESKKSRSGGGKRVRRVRIWMGDSRKSRSGGEERIGRVEMGVVRE